MGFFSYALKHEINFNIVRFHNVYGPRMGYDHVIPELYKRIENIGKNKSLELFGWSNTRSFCYIDDAVDALLLFRKNIKAKIVHIGDDREEIKIFDLCKKMTDILGKDFVIRKSTAPKGSVNRRKPDISKLRSFGYKPKVSLNQGIKKTIAWYSKVI